MSSMGMGGMPGMGMGMGMRGMGGMGMGMGGFGMVSKSIDRRKLRKVH